MAFNDCFSIDKNLGKISEKKNSSNCEISCTCRSKIGREAFYQFLARRSCSLLNERNLGK